ncbi:MAG: TlpA disulfide reductase family protein [Gemmatimonadota bacterium]
MSTAPRWLLFFTVALAGCRPGARSDAPFRPLDIGADVPLYRTRTLAGDTIAVGGAGQVTLLNVWATWCASCREEMADLTALQREGASRNLRVVGVSVDQGDGSRVRRYAEAEKIGFTVAHDPEGEVQRSYQVPGVPSSYLISREGKLLWQHSGNLHDVLPELREAINRAVEAKP